MTLITSFVLGRVIFLIYLYYIVKEYIMEYISIYPIKRKFMTLITSFMLGRVTFSISQKGNGYIFRSNMIVMHNKIVIMKYM